MKASRLSALAIAVFSLFVGRSAKAELLNLGQASGGQSIALNTQSIQQNGSWTRFTYYLGNERLDATANCGRGSWRVEGQEYTPQSQATRNMISVVCSAAEMREVEDMGYVLVFDPPSNIRSSPGGPVKCTLDRMRVIRIYVEPNNGWYSTSECNNGWIHQSQIRTFR